MTTYNREIYVAEAIESVLASTYKNFELIIVDDGSTDTTLQIAKKYVASDDRISVYKNQKNLGDYPNRNKAASYAKGEYIFYLDSDDKIFPDTIQQLTDLMLQHPEASFALYSTLSKEPMEMKGDEAIKTHFFKTPFLNIGPGGTIQKLKFFNKLNGYPQLYGPANDMYYNLKACCYSSIVLIPYHFMFYRLHEGQEKNNAYSYLHNSYNFLNDALNNLPLPLTSKDKNWIRKKNKRRFFTNIIRFLIKSKDWSKTKNAIRLTNFKTADVWSALF